MSAVLKFKNDAASSDPALIGWTEFAANNPAPDWVQGVRKVSRDNFALQSTPSKGERYKYTNIMAAVRHLNLSFDKAEVTAAGCTEFVESIMDSVQKPQPWLRAMITAQPVGDEKYKDMALWDAVNAYLRDGVVLDVPAKTMGKDALHITINGHDGAYFVPRTFLNIGEQAEFTIIEHHIGDGTYWNNRLTQIHVQKGARLRHYRIQENSEQAVYTQNTHVTLERDATYEAFVLTAGASLSRNQIHVQLNGENAEARLAGVSLLHGAQHADTTITIDHNAPNCRSNQTYKTILDDRAHGVFQGKVFVDQIAQRTDGYQLHNALLLSKTAEMSVKPELEIYADDVKCSHGATTGQMDTGPLFYLRSRGLSEAEAKLLLMQAFLGPALAEIRDETVQEEISELALNWLQRQTVK